MRLDRNIGRPRGRCQVTISPPSRVGHTGHVRHADIVARSRYSREDVAARSRRDGPGRPGSTAHRTTQQAERTRRSGEAPMARRDTSPDFIEALARGLDVIRAFQPGRPAMSLAAVAGATGLARPTARRILLTLEQMG